MRFDRFKLISNRFTLYLEVVVRLQINPKLRRHAEESTETQGSVGGGPDEADAPLVVDPDAVLPGSVAPERFQLVTRRYLEFIQLSCGIQHQKFVQRPPMQSRIKTLRTLPSK